MKGFDEIERIQDPAQRIKAYQAFVAAQPSYHLAWSNLALDLADARRWVEARRAALMVQNIDRSLSGAAPRCAALLDIGKVHLGSEVVATENQVVYRGTGPDGTVLLRALLDCDSHRAAALFGEHETVTRHEPFGGIAIALGSELATDGTLFQILADIPGRTLHEMINEWRIEAARALAIVERVSAIVVRARAEGRSSLELRPDSILVDDTESTVVTLLGPLTWRGDARWRAPEEAAGAAPGPTGDVYRLGLLTAVAVTGQPPPALGQDGHRWLADFPPGQGGVVELVTRSLALDPSARPDADTWRAALTAARGGPTSTEPALRKLGGMALVRELGRGRFATVYEAVTRTGERRAVKVLHPSIAADGELRLRFFNEARFVSDLDHPGVIRVFEHGSDQDDHYLVMELAQGGSLGDRLAARGPLPPREAADVGIQVAHAMQAAHTPGPGGRHVIHRDLKPGNILYRKRGDPEVAVTDFGIAKLNGEPTEYGLPLTSIGRPLGTPAYMAPEQWMMVDDLDARADIYSLGVVLYELLAGKLPFTGRNEYELQQAHLTKEPPSLAGAGIPQPLADIIQRMMAKDRAVRYATMAEVAAALDQWSSGELVSPPPPPPPSPPTPWPRWLLPVGALLVLAALGLVVWKLWPTETPRAAVLADAAPAGPIDAGIDAAIAKPHCTFASLDCTPYFSALPRMTPAGMQDLGWKANNAVPPETEKALCLSRSPSLLMDARMRSLGKLRYRRWVDIASPADQESSRVAGAANFELSRGWEARGCPRQAVEAVEKSHAVRSRRVSGWGPTCDRCKALTAACPLCP